MSGDEGFLTLIAVVLGPAAWLLWLATVRSIDTLRGDRWPQRVVLATLTALTLLIFLLLRFCAADDVREAPQYLFMYTVLGLAWLRVGAWMFAVFGLSTRDDLVERRNAAAAWAWVGAMTGVALAYSGGNIGNGPGWWVVVFSSGLASLGLAAAWFALAEWGGLAESVAVDRDRAAGVRLGGALVACGLVTGAAVTGDWISAGATTADFIVRAWPAVIVVAIALLIETRRPKPGQPSWSVVAGGVVPAVAYIATAAVSIEWLTSRVW